MKLKFSICMLLFCCAASCMAGKEDGRSSKMKTINEIPESRIGDIASSNRIIRGKLRILSSKSYGDFYSVTLGIGDDPNVVALKSNVSSFGYKNLTALSGLQVMSYMSNEGKIIERHPFYPDNNSSIIAIYPYDAGDISDYQKDKNVIAEKSRNFCLNLSKERIKNAEKLLLNMAESEDISERLMDISSSDFENRVAFVDLLCLDDVEGDTVFNLSSGGKITEKVVSTKSLHELVCVVLYLSLLGGIDIDQSAYRLDERYRNGIADGWKYYASMHPIETK